MKYIKKTFLILTILSSLRTFAEVALFDKPTPPAPINCIASHDLPLVTHYSQSSNTVLFGATDKINYNNPNFSGEFTDYLAHKRDYVSIYTQSPQLGEFIGNNYSTDTYTVYNARNSSTNYCDRYRRSPI